MFKKLTDKLKEELKLLSEKKKEKEKTRINRD
jgi:hypothetical protein